MASRLLPPALLVVAAASCGGPSVVSDRSTIDAWLVWSADERGNATTTWLDPDGAVRGQADGILVARGKDLYRVEARSVAVETTPCAPDEGGGHDAGPGTAGAAATGDAAAGDAAAPAGGRATALRLVAVTGDAAPIDLVVPATSPDVEEVIPADHQHDAAVTASLGPYFFVAESTYVYSCGAHGHTAASAAVVDADRQQPIVLVDPAAMTASRETARAQLAKAATEADVDPPAADAEIHLAASVPTWVDGNLAMRHLFWFDTCYACSDGEWSSYTRSTRVDDPALPAVFAALPAIPPAVARRLSASPEPRGLSWGKAGDAWAKALPAKR